MSKNPQVQAQKIAAQTMKSWVSSQQCGAHISSLVPQVTGLLLCILFCFVSFYLTLNYAMKHFHFLCHRETLNDTQLFLHWFSTMVSHSRIPRWGFETDVWPHQTLYWRGTQPVNKCLSCQGIGDQSKCSKINFNLFPFTFSPLIKTIRTDNAREPVYRLSRTKKHPMEFVTSVASFSWRIKEWKSCT